MNSSLPSGTVTFLFSDIEGSTRLWEKYPSAMQEALARHDQMLRQAIESNHGLIVKTTGDGLHAAFETAQDGLFAAFIAQQALFADVWEEIHPDVLRCRMALFTGEAFTRAGDYFGPAVNRAARLMAIGHGGQVLLSSTTADLLYDQLPEGVTLRDLGEHRLRDLVRPERVYQLIHPSLPSDLPPLKSLDVVPNNLPVQLTSFIGREREIAEVKQILDGSHPASRLVTLIGPGGTGKTRLALQAAADLLLPGDTASPFPNGAWLVEFAAQVDPRLVLETVAEVFNLREAPGSPPLVEIIINYLRAKRLLLILDNCEHLIEACAKLADTLLRTCPQIKILASSREALGISGETIYRVPSLSLPEGTSLSRAAALPNVSPGLQATRPLHVPTSSVIPATGASNHLVDELMQYESIQLFVVRARAAQAHFSLNERNAQAVSRICQRLDGIPLALELAASRVQVFSPEQIAARLDDRFRLLTGGSRTALHRQQTLRALIDWSYDMLSVPEQALFRRLSVFTGGWTYDAAEAVCSELDVLYLLTNLVNKSMVIVNEQGSEVRYGFLETIRQYARDKLLEMGEAKQARDRHLDYYLRFSQDTDMKIVEPGAIEWLDQLDLEAENIRSAIEWGLEDRPIDALALIGNLFIYFTLRGNLREIDWLAREALFQVEQYFLAGEHTEPAQLRVKARGLAAMGMFAMSLGEIPTARPLLEQSIALARKLQDPLTMYFGIGILAHALNLLNEPQAAKETAEESLAFSRKQGIRWGVAMSLGTLAWAEGRLGNKTRRAELLGELRELIVVVDNPLMFDAQMMMGIEARAYGDLANGRILLEQCLSYLPVLRSRPFEGMVRSELAHITRQSGDFQAAREAYCQTLQLWIDLGHLGAIAHQLECFAFMERAEGKLTRAARLFGAAEALREGIPSPMTDYELSEYQQELSFLREALPDSAFSREWSAGRGMEMEEAVAYAIGTELM